MDWTPLREFVDHNSDFLLTTHVRTDGDGLGSELALADLLRRAGKSVRIVNPSPVPPRYAFLDPAGLVRSCDSGVDAGLLTPDTAVLIVDTNSWRQLDAMADTLEAHPGPRLCIDHHISQPTIDGSLLVDETAEATGVLVLEAMDALGVPIGAAAARALFVAVATDTGWFRFTSVRVRTYQIAARLTGLGVDPADLYARLYQSNRIEALKLRSRLLTGLSVVENGQVCYGMLSRDDFRETGVCDAETEDLVNVTLTVAGVELGLLFVEMADGRIKLSLRSRRHVDCSALARQLGGGGHLRASGATLEPPLADARARVLDLVHTALAAAP